MMKWVSSVVLIFLAVTSFAQILDNSACQAFTDEPFFNPKFVKNNAIKSISSRVATKRTMDIVRRSDVIHYYEFDTLGRQVLSSTSFRKGSSRDTTVVCYAYNNEGCISVKRRNDVHGYFSYNYEYDSVGRVVKETYCRDENIGRNKHQFKLGEQFVIVDETYTYEDYKNQTRRYYYNNLGRVYQEEVCYFDSNYLMSIERKLKMGNNRSKETFKYDEKGRVIEHESYSTVGENTKLVIRYRYDAVGNLLFIDEYKNDIHITNKEILYLNNMLFNGQVIHDIATNIITIINYDYEFY